MESQSEVESQSGVESQLEAESQSQDIPAGLATPIRRASRRTSRSPLSFIAITKSGRHRKITDKGRLNFEVVDDSDGIRGRPALRSAGR